MSLIINLVLGILFGLGLIVSDFFNPLKIASCLDFLSSRWDPSVLYTFFSSAAVAWCLFAGAHRFFRFDFSLFKNNDGSYFSGKILAGTILFGVGWGLTGLNPSSAILNLSFGRWETILFFICVVAGLFLDQFIWRDTQEKN